MRFVVAIEFESADPAAVTTPIAWRSLVPRSTLRRFPQMPRFAVLIMLVLAGCELFDTSQPTEFGSGDMKGWRFASGKTPSRAEYAALDAACQDGAVRPPMVDGGAGPLDACRAAL